MYLYSKNTGEYFVWDLTGCLEGIPFSGHIRKTVGNDVHFRWSGSVTVNESTPSVGACFVTVNLHASWSWACYMLPIIIKCFLLKEYDNWDKKCMIT